MRNSMHVRERCLNASLAIPEIGVWRKTFLGRVGKVQAYGEGKLACSFSGGEGKVFFSESN